MFNILPKDFKRSPHASRYEKRFHEWGGAQSAHRSQTLCEYTEIPRRPLACFSEASLEKRLP